MWFVFGFVTLLSFSLYYGWKRLNAAWRGEARTAGGVRYELKLERNKHGIVGFMLGVDGPPGYDFAFKRETAVDRLFKHLGIAVEHQVGHDDFDRRLYIVSDDRELLRGLSADRAVIESGVALTRCGPEHNCGLRELRCSGGRLWAHFRGRSGFRERDIDGVTAVAVPALDAIRQGIARLPLRTASSWRDPFVVRAAIILAISTGLAVNGLVQVARINFAELPFTLDVRPLFIWSGWCAAGAVVVLVATAIIALGRSARTHLVLIEIVLVGSFGAYVTALTELRDLNIELDDGAPARFETSVMSKWTTQGKGGTKHYLDVDDWTREQFSRRLRVSPAIYAAGGAGDRLEITQRPGHFNWRWVAGYTYVAHARKPEPVAEPVPGAAGGALPVWRD
jgi:hypothetical protein